jgi:peptide/nickel transport system permease protein
MTLRHLGPVMHAAEQRPASEASRRLLAAVASGAAGSPLRSAAALEDHVARHAADWTPEILEERVARWLEAARRLVAARVALRQSAGPVTESDWTTAVLALEGLEAEIAPAGGLLVAPLMPLLLRESPHVKESGVQLLSACAGWRRPYRAWSPPGEVVRPEDAVAQAAADRGLMSTWRRERLHYTEIGGPARVLWYSWTDTRYANWLGNVLRLDFGESLQKGRPVMDLVWERLPTTLFLQVSAIALMYLIAVPLGAWSAVRAGTRRERGVTVLLFLLYAAPSFWIATMALYFLASPDHLTWFPLEGLRSPEMITALEQGHTAWWSWSALRDLAWHAVLPIFVLTYGGVCVLSRYGRSGMLEVLREDYVRTARAKGLPERQVILRHALRNGILPLVAFFPAILPALVGGSVVVEMIFGIPGMGLLAWDSARACDVPVAMALITLTAVLTMVGYALADVVYGILNPRTWQPR